MIKKSKGVVVVKGVEMVLTKAPALNRDKTLAVACPKAKGLEKKKGMVGLLHMAICWRTGSWCHERVRKKL